MLKKRGITAFKFDNSYNMFYTLRKGLKGIYGGDFELIDTEFAPSDVTGESCDTLYLYFAYEDYYFGGEVARLEGNLKRGESQLRSYFHKRGIVCKKVEVNLLDGDPKTLKDLEKEIGKLKGRDFARENWCVATFAIDFIGGNKMQTLESADRSLGRMSAIKALSDADIKKYEADLNAFIEWYDEYNNETVYPFILTNEVHYAGGDEPQFILKQDDAFPKKYVKDLQRDINDFKSKSKGFTVALNSVGDICLIFN